ncbi:MAG: hypothetical protein ACP5G5_03450 [Thermoplasmata archaeon]|jgi:hypothetical protein|nr:hypothetical protein [Thermoplasmatales archaeon]
MNMDAKKFTVNTFLGFFLIAMLWWLPLFGPMISGYVVGRRSENAKYGAIATGIPAVTFFILSYLIYTGYIIIPVITFPSNLDPSGILAYINGMEYAVSKYLGNYFYFLKYAPPYFAIMIIFGIVGGALAKPQEEFNKRPKKVPQLKEYTLEKPKGVHPLVKRAMKQKKHEIDEEYI